MLRLQGKTKGINFEIVIFFMVLRLICLFALQPNLEDVAYLFREGSEFLDGGHGLLKVYHDDMWPFIRRGG